jgi:hypothetical protein
MTDFSDNIALKGAVQAIIDYRDGSQKIIDYEEIPNTVLRDGRIILARTLANKIGTVFSFYITRMVFGDGGSVDGVKKFVNADRNGLFGTTRLSKPVIATIDPNFPTQVIFTSVITFEDIVGVAISEMALQMNNGDLYSMTTFPDLTKTAEMAITFNWRLSFL